MAGLQPLTCALAEFVKIGKKLVVECFLFWLLRLSLNLVLWSAKNRIVRLNGVSTSKERRPKETGMGGGTKHLVLSGMSPWLVPGRKGDTQEEVAGEN